MPNQVETLFRPHRLFFQIIYVVTQVIYDRLHHLDLHYYPVIEDAAEPESRFARSCNNNRAHIN